MLCRCRPESRIVIDERGTDHVDNLALVALALHIGRTLPGKTSTREETTSEERDHVLQNRSACAQYLFCDTAQRSCALQTTKLADEKHSLTR